ncbi:MAG: hypothetical protein AAFY88_09910, partial [Acidobacteriota bacterium]
STTSNWSTVSATALAVATFAAVAFAPSASADETCGEVYAACQQQLSEHARCAASYPDELVTDASAIFELEHRVETSASVGAFGPDPASTDRLERVLAGVKATADASLSDPGGVELVLIGDLHRRHADRLESLLAAPQSCDEKSLARLERSCRAGVGEVKALTRNGWPSHVSTCVDTD